MGCHGRTNYNFTGCQTNSQERCSGLVQKDHTPAYSPNFHSFMFTSKPIRSLQSTTYLASLSNQPPNTHIFPPAAHIVACALSWGCTQSMVRSSDSTVQVRTFRSKHIKLLPLMPKMYNMSCSMKRGGGDSLSPVDNFMPQLELWGPCSVTQHQLFPFTKLKPPACPAFLNAN